MRARMLRISAARRRRWVAAALIAAATIAAVSPSRAEDPEIATRRAAERKTFTDAEIIDGFLKITIGAEMQVAGRVDRIRRFEKPVRVYVDNRGKPDRAEQVAQVVADIASRVANLDIAMVDERSEANVIVTLVRERDFDRTLRSFFGRARASQILRSLEPQCLSGFSKDENYRIDTSFVLLVVNAGDFIFHDCVYEELLQSLGPINDDDSVPWTMFNDDVQMGFFDVYDQYILNILYHPLLRAGMTRAEVEAVLPKVLPDVRAHVARINGLKP